MVTDNLNRQNTYREFVGLSTDNKPTEGVGVNSLFRELDSGKTFYFTGVSWARVGGAE